MSDEDEPEEISAYVSSDPVASRIGALVVFAKAMYAVELKAKTPLTLAMMNEVMVAAAMTLGAKAGELHDIEDAHHERVLRELKRN